MNPIVLRFADGTAFFVGLALAFAAEMILLVLTNDIARRVLNVLALVGIVLVILSATPQPLWAYLTWGMPAVGGLILLKNSFGHAQRIIASKYGVALLPKRYFARVLGTPGGTLDGLHLSQAGHDAMAGIIAEVIWRGNRTNP
jgi:lysophospholipase L1-like esterase